MTGGDGREDSATRERSRRVRPASTVLLIWIVGLALGAAVGGITTYALVHSGFDDVTIDG